MSLVELCDMTWDHDKALSHRSQRQRDSKTKAGGFVAPKFGRTLGASGPLVEPSDSPPPRPDGRRTREANRATAPNPALAGGPRAPPTDRTNERLRWTRGRSTDPRLASRVSTRALWWGHRGREPAPWTRSVVDTGRADHFACCSVRC